MLFVHSPGPLVMRCPSPCPGVLYTHPLPRHSGTPLTGCLTALGHLRPKLCALCESRTSAMHGAALTPSLVMYSHPVHTLLNIVVSGIDKRIKSSQTFLNVRTVYLVLKSKVMFQNV